MIPGLGEAINAGSRLIGGWMDAEDRDDQRAHDAAQRHMDREYQQKFAQMGVRWKVDDARAAGVHPLYALGANTVSFSPVGVGDPGRSNWSETLGSMGQDISRAVNATRTEGERETAAHEMLVATQLEGARLDNDIKKTEIASRVQKLKQAGSGPPTPDVVPRADEFEDRPRLAAGKGEFKTDPGHANAEDFEKRYGDIAQELAGAVNMWADYNANFRDGESPLNRRIREFIYDNFRVPGRKGDHWHRRYWERHYGPRSPGRP